MSCNAYIFPGQGSQYVGMGKDLAAEFPEIRSLFQKADELVDAPLSKFVSTVPKKN
jgi:[acyl-carrier-protein] S-malonyltransferase